MNSPEEGSFGVSIDHPDWGSWCRSCRSFRGEIHETQPAHARCSCAEMRPFIKSIIRIRVPTIYHISG